MTAADAADHSWRPVSHGSLPGRMERPHLMWKRSAATGTHWALHHMKVEPYFERGRRESYSKHAACTADLVSVAVGFDEAVEIVAAAAVAGAEAAQGTGHIVHIGRHTSRLARP